MGSDKYMRKGGMVKSMEAGDADMAAINAIALEPLDKGDVYTFEVVACDNDIDRRKAWCEHRWGKEYDGEACHFTLSDISDAYELSFVAIPAQRGAGTKKEYLLDGEEPSGPAEAKTEEKAAGAPEGAHSISRAKALAAAFLATIER